MMKYLLVEDERFAYEEMKRMMEKLRPDYQLEAWTATVEQTVQFLKHHPVDLMLLDIRLTDGNSFDIFEQIQVTTPVIFTTAYDEHAIQAFKVNSVDYLLKPVEEDDLLAALRKFEQFRV
ncbi:LytR/AlgR family response regulator transcription factor, partial [Bacteroides cellulosilyticus]